MASLLPFVARSRAGWLLVFLFLLSAGPVAQAQAPPYSWAAGVGTTTRGVPGTADRHDCEVHAVAADGTGQTYVTGHFRLDVDFGTTTLTSAGEHDAFLAKFNANGLPLWATRIGGIGDEFGYDVAVDAAGNAYVTGYFQASITLGSYTLTSGGVSSGFVAQFSPQGVCNWAYPVAVAGGGCASVAVEAGGDVVVSGNYFGRPVQFGSTTLQPIGSSETCFVARLSPAGIWRWAVSSGHRNGRVTLDATGNVYVAGCFGNSFIFGNTTLTCRGLQDGFVGKLDPSGNWRWVQIAGGPGYDYASGIGVDYAGNVWVAGGFGQPEATFGAFSVPNRGAGSFDAFVAKLDPNGTYLWATSAGSTDGDLATDLAVDDDGSAYVTGMYQDYGPGVAFGSILLPNLNRRFGQSYVARLSPDGNFEWVSTTSLDNFGEFGNGIALDHRGGVYAAGYYGGVGIGFGPTTLVGNPGAYTGYLAKIGDSPLPKVVAVSPAQGPAGTVVTVRGARLTGATAVYFNGQPAASFTVTSPSTLTAVAPVGVTSGPVSVQTPAGSSPAGPPFEAAPLTSPAAARPTVAACWPNPLEAGQPLHLALPGGPAAPAHATLYSLLGQAVYSSPLSLTGEWKLPPLPTGSYVVAVQRAGQVIARHTLRIR